VVDCQIAFCSAVLTLEIVALENILPGKINALVGGVDISVEANNRRHRKGFGYGMNLISVGRAHQFAFVEVYKNKSSLHGTNHERTEILIEYQNPIIHSSNIKPLSLTNNAGPCKVL
jgi:hypothetical protein